MVDLYPGQGASATAANNLYRCLAGAGTTAFIDPLINTMGVGRHHALSAHERTRIDPRFDSRLGFHIPLSSQLLFPSSRLVRGEERDAMAP